MTRQRSSLAGWALQRRIEAHVLLPGVISLVLILLYFFGPAATQSLIAPGVIDIPFSDGRKLGIAQLLIGVLLAWILLLGSSILALTREIAVWLITVLLMVAIVFMLLMWLDGHSLGSRASAIWFLAADPGETGSGVIGQLTGLFDLLVIGLITLVFFILVPVFFHARRNRVAAMLIPSRWLSMTALVMIASFWLAFKLQGQGWDQVMGESGALGGNLTVFVLPVFLYMVLLYVARIQYRSWLRYEAEEWDPSRRS